MPFETPLNMNSAMLVRDELNKSLEKIVQYVEAYLADPGDPQLLSNAVAELHQVNGILRVLEFHGAIELSGALLLVCQSVLDGELDLNDAATAELARGFVLLPRFIEYSIKVKNISPLAVNDSVNQLRAMQRLAPLLEAEQIGFQPGSSPVFDSTAAAPAAEDLSRVKRLLHMYQVGLLGVLRERNTAANLHLMERSISRLRRDYAGLAAEEWWILVSACLHLMGCGELRMTFSRKRVLGAIDAYLRKRGRDVNAPTITLSACHRNELLYLIEVSGDKSELSEALRQQYGLPAAPFDDAMLGRLEVALAGSGENLLSDVAREIQSELGQVKDLLEVYSEAMTVETAGNVASRLQKVAEILGRSGFSRLKGMLVDKAFQFNQGMAAGVTDREAMQALAETMLMVENTLEDPELFNDLALSGDAQGTEMLARSLLDEATGVVINECKSAISLAKRGITAYQESSFDVVHVANVGASLSTVRGAFQVMGHGRAAAVLQQCIDYIDGFGTQGGAAKSGQSVETLADALISIEYYLDELSVSDRENLDLLAIAEESVAELVSAA